MCSLLKMISLQTAGRAVMFLEFDNFSYVMHIFTRHGHRHVACDLIEYPWSVLKLWPPRVLGIWGEWPFIFRELGSTGNYFQGFGEQAHSFGDSGSPAKKF